ncbi:Vitamin B6 transporter [Recurvomyces mirabilis]|uniref:Vitamin B6 transporter n=1 Tax=Recurvomyces mirabilis TaxID=574656 RepID=A0AAE0WH69_9PEZI|nr:Vitamin B6 transporter [Recurvomyces mirabilis]KAK5150567.1 Vitamin B6 transporter [Recurvomyces mirabilis]
MASSPGLTVSEEKPHLHGHDAEKTTPSGSDTDIELNNGRNKKYSTLRHINARIEGLAGFEARGLTRVQEDERQPASFMSMLQMLLLWFSANMTINNLAVAILGPITYGLGFADSAWCAVIGVFLGALTTSYMSTWGAVSGNRTMVVTRYFMGYYPSKITTLLNIILMEGYCTIDCIIGGQVLSAVSGGTMTIAVGVIIVAIIQCIIASFGLKLFHVYERFAWLPQLLVLLILVGVSAKNFNSTLASSVTGSTLSANRLSFLSLCFYVPNSWGAASSDYYVYYPSNTPKWKTFGLTLAGLSLSFWFVDLVGIGLGCGVAALPAWSDAYTTSSGALISEGFSPLGGFGKFCSVVIAFGVIANAVPGVYSAAIGCQIMGRWGQLLPRWVWVVVLCCIQLVCGVAGRNQLFIIFTNFLALMGYWLSVMVCIVLEEHLIFRPKLDWTAWADRSALPVGVAALVTFLLGWMGAILGMYQIWYVGPLAALAGDADVGMWVGCAFTLVSIPPLRWLELKKFGR